MSAARPVAVVTSTIPLTVATFHQELIRQLVVAGYDVLVVSSPGADLERVAVAQSVRVRAIPMVREIALLADLRALASWVSLCRNEKPGVVVAATPKASMLALVAARVTGVAHRLYYLGGLRLEGESGRRRSLLAAMERLTGGCATQVVANSPSLARRAAELGLFRAAKVRRTEPGSSHGVDSAHFAPRPADPTLAARLGLDLGRPVVGLVGRLTHDKGIDPLVEALRLLGSRDVDVQLLVVGPQDEPDSAAYLERLRALGTVVTVGRVDDVRPFFALMDLHVLPSLREGFPNVVLEAAAMGLATVTTDATGCVDSVRDGETGLVVPAGAAAPLADALAALLSDDERRRRMGDAARAWVSTEFRPEAVVASLLGGLTTAPLPRARR